MQTKDLPEKWEESTSSRIMYSVHQLHGLVQKHLEQTLVKEKAISFSQFMVLMGFACEEQTPLSQATIAEFSNLTEATVSRHITILVSLGFLSKEENKENRRKFRIAITKKGIHAFKKAEKILHKELTNIFSNISEKNAENIIKNFNNILHNLLNKK
jgi:DNA-binding MarR family transcriptional regulator